MVFYFPGKPLFVIGSLGELVHAPALGEIENSVFWLDVWGFDLPLLTVLAKVFGIHPLTIDDVYQEREQTEKCELFASYTFVGINALLEKNEET